MQLSSSFVCKPSIGYNSNKKHSSKNNIPLRISRRFELEVCSRAGGPQNSPMGSRLIIPGGGDIGGMGGTGGQAQQGGQGNQQRKGPVLPPSAPPEGGAFYQPWRRPMEEAPLEVQQGVDRNLSMDEQMQFIRERRGPWHLLAKYIMNLQSMSITAEIIEESCGVTPRDQNLWQVASNVYYSLVEMPDFDQETRQFYEIMGSQGVLYALRTLNQQDRLKATQYCAAQGADETLAMDLSKAMKDYKYRSRVALMEGFSDDCGDVRAFKFYREAIQQKGDYRDRLAEEGLQVATSQSAKMSLQRLIAIEEDELDGETAFATLPIVTLQEEEQSYWPLAVLGTLEDTSRSLWDNVPPTFCEGPFKTFKPQGGVRMAALPLFAPVATADDPVAILVPDVQALDIPTLQAKPGEAMLVVDREKRAPTSDAFFVVFQQSSLVIGGAPMEKASIQSGRDIAGTTDMKVVGKVVLAVRPSFQRKASVFGPGDAVVDV